MHRITTINGRKIVTLERKYRKGNGDNIIYILHHHEMEHQTLYYSTVIKFQIGQILTENAILMIRCACLHYGYWRYIRIQYPERSLCKIMFANSRFIDTKYGTNGILLEMAFSPFIYKLCTYINVYMCREVPYSGYYTQI